MIGRLLASIDQVGPMDYVESIIKSEVDDMRDQEEDWL
jgi:hypothetical protein